MFVVVGRYGLGGSGELGSLSGSFLDSFVFLGLFDEFRGDACV